MDSYYKERGVFLSSSNLDSRLLLICLDTLLSYYPFIKFSSIIADDNYQGFRVLFSGNPSPQELKLVLEKKQLIVQKDIVQIYPLTTVLAIQDIGVVENLLFEDDVLKAVSDKYGKVLDVMKFDSEAIRNVLNSKFQNSLDDSNFEIWDKKWLVRIDIPEFEGLEVFCQDPELVISLPKWNKNLRVSFWCRICKKCGHFQYNCVQKMHIDDLYGGENSSNKKSGEIYENKILPHSDSSSTVSEEAYENFPAEPTYSSENEEKRKKRTNSSESNQSVKKSKKNESTSNSNVDQDNSLLTIRKIKQEIEDDEESNTSDIEKNSSKADDNVLRFMTYEEGVNDDNLDRNSNSNDDAPPNNSKKTEHSSRNDASDFAKKGHKIKSEESSNKASTESSEKEKTTSPQLTTPGPSHATSATSSSILGAADTGILSDELQGYVNTACEKVGALDRQTLDAFLGYVKKKNKPSHIALKYTKDVKKLKEQLQMILQLRYHNKPTNQTKEDGVFIKWLEGLVSRFDNTTPSKRKRTGQD